MKMTKKRKILLAIMVCIAILPSAILLRRTRPQNLLHSNEPLGISVTHLSVHQGLGSGQDVTYRIDRDELLYLLSNTQIRRNRGVWIGTTAAEWEIRLRQSGNQFHRTIIIALGDTHMMMTERGFGHLEFRISNGDEIIEALERNLQCVKPTPPT